MSAMTEKRQALANELETILQSFHSDFRVEQRFRKATFIAESRSERVDIMGKDTTYCEVLYEPVDADSPRADASWRDKLHSFVVRIWYGFSEAKTLTKSSQKTWDEITEGASGVLRTLETKSGLTINSDFYTMFNPQNITERTIVLDKDGKEFAHFLQFNIQLRI